MNLHFDLSFAVRIALTLPPWFGSTHPNLDATVAGFAAAHTTVSAQITALLPFTRLMTVPGEMLDLAAYDFLGSNIARNIGEADTSFRPRFLNSLFQTSGTRPDFIRQTTTATGAAPIIYDLRQPNDVKYIGSSDGTVIPTFFLGGIGAQARGVLTNYKMGYQWFVQLKNVSNVFTDPQLLVLINTIMPAGTVCWTYIS